MEVKWLNHGGKKILYGDYRGAKTETELINILKEVIELEKKGEGKLLELANFSDTYIGTNFMNEVNKSGKDIRAKYVAKTALVGVTGLKNVLLMGYITFTGQKNIKSFSTENEALRWLIE
jgi:hypothetical protein